ncbi:hypothetical protein EBR57_06255 [bacterium]|nr:hypothetical protein [bacterium]
MSLQKTVGLIAIVTLGVASLTVLLQKIVFGFGLPIPVFKQLFYISIIASFAALASFKLALKRLNFLTGFFIVLSYFASINLISVYTTIFIDRSLTYHAIFYAVEHEGISKPELSVLFCSPVYLDQRIQDMTQSQFLIPSADGTTYIPTRKATLFSYILRPYAQLTGLDTTYVHAIKELDND